MGGGVEYTVNKRLILGRVLGNFLKTINKEVCKDHQKIFTKTSGFVTQIASHSISSHKKLTSPKGHKKLLCKSTSLFKKRSIIAIFFNFFPVSLEDFFSSPFFMRLSYRFLLRQMMHHFHNRFYLFHLH